MIHIKIDEPYRKKAFKTSTSTFQSSNKSQAPNQKMRIAKAALILVFLAMLLFAGWLYLSTMYNMPD